MKAADAISGQEGRAYATIKGRAEEMFYVKSIEVTVKKNKKEIRTLGKRGDQHKANG
ncbi:phage tail tube protein, partial [Paenibacillus larvae]